MQILNSIEADGFKSFEQIRLDLGDLNVIIGPNGAGKSNLISLFRFLTHVVSQNLQPVVAQAGGAERFLFHGRKRTKELRLSCRFGDNGYALNLVAAAGDTLAIEDEAAHFFGFDNKPDHRVQLARGARESTLKDEASKPRRPICKHVLRHIDRWRIHHFHDTSDSAACKQTHQIDDNQDLKGDAANLAPFLMQLRDELPDAYRHVRDHVRLIAPFFDDFVLKPLKRSPHSVKLEWKQRGSDAYFDGFSLSDGTLRFMCLAALLLPPVAGPRLVLIDEPELGLHPYAINVLADMLKAAANDTQLIVATQSVTLLNQLSLEDVIVANHDGVRSTFSRPSKKALKSWLASYAVGELWEKNLLGGRPRP